MKLNFEFQNRGEITSTNSDFCVRERPSVSSYRIRLILAEKSKAKKGMSNNIFSFTQASLIASSKFLHVFFLSVATYCARASLIVSHVLRSRHEILPRFGAFSKRSGRKTAQRTEIIFCSQVGHPSENIVL